MRTLVRLQNFNRISSCPTKLLLSCSTSAPGSGANAAPLGEEEFRTLDLYRRPVRPPRKLRTTYDVQPPRYKKMSVTQDWPSVWPVAKSFHPAAVPLPMHQGRVKLNKSKPIPNKWANLELMKIANFLHLTPPAIKRHCEALKRFCTPWPEELSKEEDIDELLPFQIMTTSYCHSTPSIRDPRSRIVTLKFKLSVLNLDEHAKDKFLRLVGDRYDLITDTVTIVADSCPLSVQNTDYALYLVTALYHESNSTEEWEEEKLEEDMEKYEWDKSISKQRVLELLKTIHAMDEVKKPQYLTEVTADVLTVDTFEAKLEPVKNYVKATVTLHNKGETVDTIEEYGKSVRVLFNLPTNE